MAFADDAQAAVAFTVTPNSGLKDQAQDYNLKLTGLTPRKLYEVEITVDGQNTIEDEFYADEDGEIAIPVQTWTWGSVGCKVLNATVEAKDGTETEVEKTATININ